MARSFLSFRFLGPAFGLILLGVLLSLLHRWQPENQVRLKFEAFLSEMSTRDWESASEFIDESYSDRWGFTKERVLRESREVLQHFFSVEIGHENMQVRITDDQATVKSDIRLTGKGTAVAEMAKAEVNNLDEPFEFQWRKLSWKPWDWKLIRVDHPTLSPEGYGS